MPHVLVAGRIHPSGLARLAAAPGVTFEMVAEVSEPSYAGLIDGADALILRTQPLSAATVARASNLKVVSRHGVGYDAVDVAALNDRRIPLAIVGDVNSASVAEHAMTLLLACLKRLPLAQDAVREPGRWNWRNRLEAGEAGGKRLLILGYGRAGRHLGRMAGAFGMEVRAHDPFVTAWPEEPVASVEDLHEGLAWADAVSVHVPKGDRPVIGAEELAVLKPSAILINTARGGVVDEGALAEALRQGRLAGAGLDVFDEEPPPPDHPLLALGNVIVTPHIAGLTAESGERMAAMSVQNVLDFFAGRLAPSLIVNRDFR